MKKSLILTAFLIAIAMLLANCGSKQLEEKKIIANTKAKDDSVSKRKIDSINTVKKENLVEAKFIINSLGEDETLTPITDVSVAFRDKIIYLSKIHGPVSELEKSKYDERDIPSNAIAACTSWWAGSGTYYYIIPSKKGGIVIYQGWQDEEQTGYGYHWEKFKTISK